jgi:anti-sigma B factor antagonist
VNESLDIAPEVLPLGISPERLRGAWSGGASPGMLHRSTPPGARPVPRTGTVLEGTGPWSRPACLQTQGGPGLGLTVWNKGRSVVVSVAGDVDIATTAQLSDALCAVLSSGVRWLVCDLMGVGFLDASGLRALLIARRRAIACDAWLALACTQSQPRKIIQLTGLDTAFVIHDSVAAAAGAQQRRGGRSGLTAAAGDG